MSAFFESVTSLASGIASELTLADLNRKFFSVIICAGGSGTRMAEGVSSQKPQISKKTGSKAELAIPSTEGSAPTTKQFITLCGLPVVVRTLLRFEECPFVREIIVAAREDEIPLYADFREKYGISKLAAVAPGGHSREESAAAAFELVSAEADFVIVHDAARCLVTVEQITRVCHAALRFRAAAAACPSRDTVKVADKNGFVESTPDRSTLRCVQTPQVFDVNVYSAALHFAREDGILESATDDCSLSEHIGIMPRLVDCGYENIKLTVPSDLLFAEAILRFRGEE